ncbi:MAG: ABC transporter ATP-binding protein, partial [Acidobacteria bacterium]
MSRNIVEIFRLSFHLGGRVILRDVSVAIHEGEWVSIVGPNGAGKTTLLKCLGRIHKVGKGQIRIAGKPQEKYCQKDLARLVTYVPQANGPAPPFTTCEFVRMGRYPYPALYTHVGTEGSCWSRVTEPRTQWRGSLFEPRSGVSGTTQR